MPLQFASLCDDQEVFVWSSCLLDLTFAVKNENAAMRYVAATLPPRRQHSHSTDRDDDKWLHTAAGVELTFWIVF